MLQDEPAALLQAGIAEIDARWSLARADFEGGAIWLRDGGLPVGSAVRLRVLARDVSLVLVPPSRSSIQNILPCTVQAIVPAGHASQVLVRLQCGPTTLLSQITARAADALGLQAGQPVWTQVKSVALVE